MEKKFRATLPELLHTLDFKDNPIHTSVQIFGTVEDPIFIAQDVAITCDIPVRNVQRWCEQMEGKIICNIRTNIYFKFTYYTIFKICRSDRLPLLNLSFTCTTITKFVVHIHYHY